MTDGGYRPSLVHIPQPRPVRAPLHSDTFLQNLSLPELARMLLVEGATGLRKVIAERILDEEDDYRFERDDEIEQLEKDASLHGATVERLEAENDEHIEQAVIKDNRITQLEQELADALDEIARLSGVIRIAKDDLATLKASIDLT